MKSSEKLRKIAAKPSYVRREWIDSEGAFTSLIKIVEGAERLPELFPDGKGQMHSFAPLLDELAQTLVEVE